MVIAESGKDVMITTLACGQQQTGALQHYASPRKPVVLRCGPRLASMNQERLKDRYGPDGSPARTECKACRRILPRVPAKRSLLSVTPILRKKRLIIECRL